MKKIFVSNTMGLDEALLAIADEDAMAAIFWPWLLCALDDWGRASANPRTIKARVVPSFASVTPEMVGAWIALYERHGLVTVYQSQEGRALAVNPDAWRRYQTQIPGSRREKDASKYPAPPIRASSSEIALVLASSSENYLELARPLSPPPPPPLPSSLPPPLFPPPTPPPYNPPANSPSDSLSVSPSLSRATIADAPAVACQPTLKKPSTHPNFPYLEVFEEVLGGQATRTETRDRSLVANELREAGYTPAQCRTALEAWPAKWPTIHRTIRGLLRNMTALLAPKPAGFGSTSGRGSAAGASQRWLQLVEDNRGQTNLPARNEQTVGKLPLEGAL